MVKKSGRINNINELFAAEYQKLFLTLITRSKTPLFEAFSCQLYLFEMEPLKKHIQETDRVGTTTYKNGGFAYNGVLYNIGYIKNYIPTTILQSFDKKYLYRFLIILSGCKNNSFG